MHLVIIGNGVTGVSCAQAVRQLDAAARITIISSESAHHYSRTALMYIFMGHLRYEHTKPHEDWYWAENRLELIQAQATGLDTARQEITLDNGQTLAYDRLLLATGSRPRLADWPGQHLRGVQGLYGLPDLEQMTRDTQGIRRAVVVGGGLIGIELAEMLHMRGIHVTQLVREGRYWAGILPAEEAALVEKQIAEHHIDLRHHTELAELLAGPDGCVRAVRTTAGDELPAEWVGLAIGVVPNLALAQAGGLETGRGILVDELLQTSAPNVFAAGDCAQHRQPGPGETDLEQLWYTGRLQGQCVGHTIAGRPTPYRRGVWFNSAKFFNLEYQTYGRVPAQTPEGEASFVWQHPGGRHLLRINYRQDGPQAVTGMNALGLRQRHDVWERWLREGASISSVLKNLGQANFDPEFFRRHEKDIRRQFQERRPQPLAR
ncbi:NAD(P)/FAD-dependent oxidoreductase [uncultured Hymenobacter sp.]|uniref:NAD(P)/FAD-dependent oxidoreductase n=1 Tax=uncultured Hymenobacter sp. TaxID=170016 RepID=UPI0035CCA101